MVRPKASLIALAAAMMLAASNARAEEPPLTSAADIEDAREVLMQWTAAYQAQDYDRQWALTDPRHYRWWDRKRWRKAMTKARRKDGALTSYTIQGAAAIDAAKLPCTEMRHCYRRGIQYILFMISSAYDKAAPGQPEYVAMSKSEEGWRFGGGTFPNRPLGETAVILTEADERSYAPKLDMRQ